MNEIVNKQKGDNNTQIGEQTNIENKITVVNNGLSPSEASELAIKLFYDNFPKLQQIARDTASQRVEELSNKIIEELSNRNITDLNAFASPDVQYVLFEAQKSYARFGEREKLDILSKLVSDRIEIDEEDNTSMKIAIDKAVSVVGLLSTKQIDYLTLLFIATKVKFGHIKSIDDLKILFRQLEILFPNVADVNCEMLDTLGCIQLHLNFWSKHYSKTYGFDENEVEKILPNVILNLNGDYSTSPVGTVIAIINAAQKTQFNFNMNTFIYN